MVGLGLACALVLFVAACGSSSSGGSSGGSSNATPKLPLKAGENASAEQLNQGKKGGTLTVLSSEDFISQDPGGAYFALDYAQVYATQRPLFVYPPNSSDTLAPDLATEVPSTSNGGITDGGKTITVHIQPNVKFSPPVNRVVTSADVKAAIERLFNPNVGNGYASAYFNNIVGAASAKGGPISGITTPNATTIVFHLTKTDAVTVLGALSMPGSAPVPANLVGQYDKHAPSTYGTSFLAFTGPYMIENHNGVVKGVGYETGKSMTLVRNPNWDPSTYSSSAYKPPAYLDKINIQIGGDPNVIGPQVLKGSDMAQLDTPSKSTVHQAYTQYPSEIMFTTAAGDHYMTLNNAKGPFTNENLRRAVYANLDRSAIIRIKGGVLTGSPGTHFLTPGTSGFVQAGGYPGPDYAWNKNTSGDLKVAQQYMKAAGYPSGKYTGSHVVTIVGSNNGADELAINQDVNQDFTQLGFKTHLIQVDQSAMYSKYCQVPKNAPDVCPSGGWLRDFNNGLAMLYVPFDGHAIVPTNNSNFGLVNDPQINAAMDAARFTPDPAANAQAWANVDKMLVDKAVAVPEDFDIQPNIASGNVRAIDDIWNEGSIDFAFTSLK
jgi:peptide/nickel transport system substrate-binding protein